MERIPLNPETDSEISSRTASAEQPDSLVERLRLKEQWQGQIKVLERCGFLSTFPEAEPVPALGYRAIDGRIEPVPTWKDIEKWMNHPEQKEFLEKKREQGFTRLLLVPVRLSINSFIKNYEETIARHRKEGKLLLSDGAPVTEAPYEGKECYVWDEYKNADTDGRLVYSPKEFSENHGGLTKAELKDGWLALLAEDRPNLPKEGQGRTAGGRKQLETNKSPREYLKLLQTAPEYQGEKGYTPETCIIDAITRLEEKNEVTDDITYSCLTGAYFRSAGVVPGASWGRGLRRACLGGSYPGNRGDYLGARVSVGVKKI